MLQLPKTEASLWRESYDSPDYPELRDDLQLDVAVIGGGITGLTAAYLLKQAGKTVAVVEKDTIGGGTTGRTTGKVTAQHGLIYAELMERHGRETALAYGEANSRAIETIESIIQSEDIACDWQREDNYVFTARTASTEQFKHEAQVAAELGLPANFESSSPLPFDIAAAIRFKDQAKFNAQKYVLGLARAIEGGGCHIFEHSNAISIRDGRPCHVSTGHGAIRAQSIVVATNVPTWPLAARGGYCLLEYPNESYIVAGKLAKEFPGMYISPDKRHYSILPISDNGTPMLLIGGEGHISGLRGYRRGRFQKLAKYAEKYFGITEITHRWSDRDYLAYDNVPLIGKLYPWSYHIYVGTAYRKWGLSGGTMAGMLLRDMIVEKENAWAKTFTPQRTAPIKSIPHVVAQHLFGKG